MADDAVAMLRERGFDAVKLDGGWPEWFAEQPSSAERVI
jgi:rhodanese-related sulfurtransferase